MRFSAPTISRPRGCAATLVLGLMLAGCSGGVSGLFAPPESQTFDLNAPESVKPSGRISSAQLVIPEPTALRWLDSDRIVVKPTVGEINYLPSSQWSDRLPKLLQTRLIETFERARRFRAVVRPGEGVSSDYALQVEIRNFEVRVSEPNEVYIALSARLISANSGRSISTKLFEVRGPVSAVEVKPVTGALDAALANALADIAAWTAKTL